MKASFDPQFDPRLDSLPDDSAVLARTALDGVALGARSGVVNRTHRVVRERATVMQARRSRARGLMLPMIICSALLLLTAFAVWSGLYQNTTTPTGAVQADVSAPAAMDVNNHSMVALLWFVPVGMAAATTVLYRRRSESAHDKAGQ